MDNGIQPSRKKGLAIDFSIYQTQCPSSLGVFHEYERQLAGWWIEPSEKYESQLGLLFPIYRRIRNVPNHQPVGFMVDLSKQLMEVLKQQTSRGSTTSCILHEILHPMAGLTWEISYLVMGHGWYPQDTHLSQLVNGWFSQFSPPGHMVTLLTHPLNSSHVHHTATSSTLWRHRA